MAAVTSLALRARLCRRKILRLLRFPHGDPLASLVKTARSLNYGAGGFPGPDEEDVAPTGAKRRRCSR